jgi:hypothetical protein
VTVTEGARGKESASVRGRVEGAVVSRRVRGGWHGMVVLKGGMDDGLRLSHESREREGSYMRLVVFCPQ